MLGEVHPWRDTGSLILHAVVILVVAGLAFAAFNFGVERFVHHTPTREELGFYVWAAAVPLTATAWLLHAFGGRKLNAFVDFLLGWLFGEPRTPR